MADESITLGGGCFWCLEAVFQRMQGVRTVVSGYMGGDAPNPTYKQICTGTTGHAEVVQVTFDPAVADLDAILDVFFTIHDPTTPNRQGNDVGTQYRSAIFTHSAEQEAAARAAVERLEKSGQYRDPIVTEIAPATTFYQAEDYHQDYFNNNGRQPYCVYVVAPKVEKFLTKHAERANVR
ncbi:MAG: peptide-methionine (S)-S-oxide reductase MsrA [Bryobacteraceae bacterium]